MSTESCENHAQHLCELNRGQLHKNDPDAYARLVKDPQYVCKNCGRVAAETQSLCAPVRLGTWEE
jgi:hypothetical protein